jgi:hypothetical protein
MSVNVSVITETSVDITEATVEGYKTNVLRHTEGDFGAHNSVVVHAEPYLEPVTGHKVSDLTLRMSLRDHNGNVLIVALPAVFVGLSPGFNGPPIILQQPVSVQTGTGSQASFFVTAVSPTPINYQWYYSNVSTPSTPIAGATDSTYIINPTTLADYGTYQVILSNTSGTDTASNFVYLTL